MNVRDVLHPCNMRKRSRVTRYVINKSFVLSQVGILSHKYGFNPYLRKISRSFT